jgi:zinc protease
MRTPRLLFALVAALLAVVARGQPLPTDPRLVTGELPNGVRYIVRQHDNPPHRAAVWMHVGTGSLNETDQQRGVAHYLEHMAFNGTEHFPPGSVIPFFQSLGLTFGQHQNAFTSFEQTTFQLALPDNKPETLDKALLFMSDVAFRQSLPPKEIQDERQVILEEWRTRLSGRQRVNDEWLERLIPGSTFGQRLPIGTEASIKGLADQDFHDYYGQWYVPANITVMVVADMEPAAVVEQITKQFSAAPRKPAPPARDAGVKPYTQTRAIVASDKELPDAELSLVWVAPPEPPTTTVQTYRGDLVEAIGSWCFNRRLQKKVAQGKLTLLSGGASSSSLFHLATLSQVSARSEPGKWRQALTEIATELQRARLHGFDEQEIADARKEILSGAERALETEPTAPASTLLASFNGAITDGATITSAAEDLKEDRGLIPGITAAEVSARFNQLFDTTKPVTFGLQMPSGGDVPTEAQLVELGTKDLDVKPEAETEAARPTALMEKAPEPAELKDFTEDAASHVWSGWLANDARVHYRYMDYRKDTVSVVITIAGGEILEDATTRGRTQAGAMAWSRPATSKLSSTEIRDLMTGTMVPVGGGPATDAMTITVGGSPEELETGLQLAYLMITDPVVEQAGFDQWVKNQKLAIAQRKIDPRGVFGDLMARTLYPADEVRTRPLTEEQVGALTAAGGQAWLRQILATGPIEVAVVGDIEKDRAMDLVRRYVGALPARARIDSHVLESKRGIKPNPGPLSAHTEIATKTDQAIVIGGFFGADARNLRDVRLLNIAGKILTTRATEDIREKQQLAYSPNVSNVAGAEYPNLGMVAFVSPTAPGKVESLVAAIDSLFGAFVKDGPTDDEMQTARKQFANSFDEQMRDPAFWADTLRALDYRGRTIANVMEAPQAYQSFSAAEVKEAFVKYDSPERTFRLWMRPASEGAPKTDPEPGTDK